MYNILIAEDNTNQSHILINCISKEIENIRLSSIASTGEETISMIENQTADIILLDLKLADHVTGIDIINYISNNNLIKYKKSIIIYSGQIDLLNKVISNSYIYSYIEKNRGMDALIKKIKELVEEKTSMQYEKRIMEKLKQELEKLKFDFSHNGTRYFLECIYEIYISNDYDNINLNNNIYPIIARKHNKSVNNIKCNITQAYIRMYYNCSKKYLEKYLNLYIGEKKPKTKDLIIGILNKI